MKANPPAARLVYRKLLALYPRTFREQLGESMEQTFADCYAERKRKQARGLLAFVLWMYLETAISAIQEQFFALKERNAMHPLLLPLRTPALLSSLLLLPFVLLEIVNRRTFNEGFPFPLFGILWTAPLLFFFTLTPVVQSLRAGGNVLARPLSLLLRATALCFLAFFWTVILADQMPCFLGVPNCD